MGFSSFGVILEFLGGLLFVFLKVGVFCFYSVFQLLDLVELTLKGVLLFLKVYHFFWAHLEEGAVTRFCGSFVFKGIFRGSLIF